MRKMILLPLVIVFILSTSFIEVSAYGWGYKRNNDHKLPEIGKYEEILEAYDAYYADESGEKVIYLTFDNGYEQGHTESILNVLQQEKVPATFFVTGHYVEEEPELIRRMRSEERRVGKECRYGRGRTS